MQVKKEAVGRLKSSDWIWLACKWKGVICTLAKTRSNRVAADMSESVSCLEDPDPRLTSAYAGNTLIFLRFDEVEN